MHTVHMEVMVFSTPMMIHQQVLALHLQCIVILMVCYMYITVLSRIPIADLSEQLMWHQRQIQEGAYYASVQCLFVVIVATTWICTYICMFITHTHTHTHTHTCMHARLMDEY